MRENRGNNLETEWDSEKVSESAWPSKTSTNQANFPSILKHTAAQTPGGAHASKNERIGIGSTVSNHAYKEFVQLAIKRGEWNMNDTDNNWNQWKKSTRLEVLQKAVTRLLNCVGVPVCKLENIGQKSAPVVFRQSEWTLYLGWNLDVPRNSGEVLELFLVLLHEIRHVEQFFRIARYFLTINDSIANEKNRVLAVAKKTGIAIDIVGQALNGPLGGRLSESSAEMQEIWDGTLGKHSINDKEFSAKAMRDNTAAKSNFLEAVKVYTSVSKNPNASKKQIDAATRAMQTAFDVHTNLEHQTNFGEKDAQQSISLFLADYSPGLLKLPTHDLFNSTMNMMIAFESEVAKNAKKNR